MDDAAIVGLCSALGSRWEDEFDVRESRLEASSIWELGGKKWRAEYSGVGAAAVENDDGLFVRENRRHD